MVRKSELSSHNFYVWVGVFAIIFIVYLWLAPKLVKKAPANPPRSGSNQEKQQMTQAIMQQQAAQKPMGPGRFTGLGPLPVDKPISGLRLAGAAYSSLYPSVNVRMT